MLAAPWACSTVLVAISMRRAEGAAGEIVVLPGPAIRGRRTAATGSERTMGPSESDSMTTFLFCVLLAG